MIIKEPVKIYLPHVDNEVKRFLTFVDRSVNYQIYKIKNNFRWASGRSCRKNKAVKRTIS
jgi:hypothetical protein